MQTLSSSEKQQSDAAELFRAHWQIPRVERLRISAGHEPALHPFGSEEAGT
jgi:predicted transposase YbfD/YdcC